MTRKREKQARFADLLETALGKGYRVYFDACDSGMTWFYYHNEFYKRIPNDELSGSINCNDYLAPVEMRIAWNNKHN